MFVFLLINAMQYVTLKLPELPIIKRSCKIPRNYSWDIVYFVQSVRLRHQFSWIWHWQPVDIDTVPWTHGSWKYKCSILQFFFNFYTNIWSILNHNFSPTIITLIKDGINWSLNNMTLCLFDRYFMVKYESWCKY